MADPDGKPIHSWRVLILPFIEQKQLYAKYDFAKPWDSPENLRLLDQRPQLFQLHGVSDDGSNDTNYLAVVGENTMWPPGKKRTHESINDPDTAILVVENTSSGIKWTEPRDLTFDSMSFGIDTDPVNGISSWLQPPAVVTANGRVRRLDMQMTQDELKSMLIINDDASLPATATELKDGRDRPTK